MHSNDHKIKDFQNNHMSTDEMIAFLEHLDNCDFCLDQMIRDEETQLSAAPGYLKEQILEKSTALEVRAGKSVVETSRKMQLFYASLRTAAGVVMALFLLFCIGETELISFQAHPGSFSDTFQAQPPSPGKNPLLNLSLSIGEGLSAGSDKISGYLNDISNKIINGGN